MTDNTALGQNVPNMAEGLYLMDGIKGLLSLPQHSVDMLLTDPPYGTTRNYWDVPLPLPELWEAVKWAVKPNGAVLFFAQCPYDKVLGASNLSMLRYEWVWYKERGTGFLNANRAPLKKSEKIHLWQAIHPDAHQQRHEYQLWEICAARHRLQRWAALSRECAVCPYGDGRHPPDTKACGAVRILHQDLHRQGSGGSGYLRWLRHNGGGGPQYGPPLHLF